MNIEREKQSSPPPNKAVKKDVTDLPVVALNAIMATEKNASDPGKKICWVLLTNLPINCDEEAIEKVHWYAKRWQIEIFHKVLKSGCAVEKAQLETAAERLKKYIVLKSLIAWRLLWLSRMHEKDAILEPIEWKLLSKENQQNKNSSRQGAQCQAGILEGLPVSVWVS